jgi:hypothetical protein
MSSSFVQAKSMWGKTEVKAGMVGKVLILKDTNLYTVVNEKLKYSKLLKKGKEFGVYGYSKSYGGVYKLNSTSYVKNDKTIKFVKIPENLKIPTGTKAPTTPNNPTKPTGFGGVKGDITWQYNDFIGTKPDVGAEIFLIPADFNPSKISQNSLKSYILAGIIPPSSNLFYAKANGYGRYEINKVPVGKYYLVISSAKTNRNPDDEIYIKELLKSRLGSSYQDFENFHLEFPKHDLETITIEKDAVLDVSHDFGNTYF